jgi:two-component system response regulator PilR (NtrC family)
MANVLYVDDEAAIRRAVVSWLTRRGHTVHAAATLAAARELLASQPIDGVFIDLWLREESGLELQAWIDENRPELSSHIVFVTGDIAAEESPSQTTQPLGRPILGKPFDLRQLDEFVRGWAPASNKP